MGLLRNVSPKIAYLAPKAARLASDGPWVVAELPDGRWAGIWLDGREEVCADLAALCARHRYDAAAVAASWRKAEGGDQFAVLVEVPEAAGAR